MAKQYFLKLLERPQLCAGERISACQGLARYYKERQMWEKMRKCCEEGLALFLEAEKDRPVTGPMKERLMLLLADAFGRAGGHATGP